MAGLFGGPSDDEVYEAAIEFHADGGATLDEILDFFDYWDYDEADESLFWDFYRGEG